MVKVMVPVGVPPPELAVTVAVKVTDSPPFDGLALEASTVVVAIWLTVWLREVAADEMLLVSPL